MSQETPEQGLPDLESDISNFHTSQNDSLPPGIILQQHGDFTCLTWNILATCYLFPNRLKYLDPQYITPDSRLQRFSQIIKNVNADVLCFQEVDRIEFISQQLTDLGYDVIFRPRGTHCQKTVNLNHVEDITNNFTTTPSVSLDNVDPTTTSFPPTTVATVMADAQDEEDGAKDKKDKSKSKQNKPVGKKNKHAWIQYNNTSLYSPNPAKQTIYDYYKAHLEHSCIDSTVLLSHILQETARTHASKIDHFTPFSDELLHQAVSSNEIYPATPSSALLSPNPISPTSAQQNTYSNQPTIPLFTNVEDAFYNRLDNPIDFTPLFNHHHLPLHPLYPPPSFQHLYSTIQHRAQPPSSLSPVNDDPTPTSTFNSLLTPNSSTTTCSPQLSLPNDPQNPFNIDFLSNPLNDPKYLHYRNNPLLSGVFTHRHKADGLLIAFKSDKFTLSMLPIEVDLNLLGYNLIYDPFTTPSTTNSQLTSSTSHPTTHTTSNSTTSQSTQSTLLSNDNTIHSVQHELSQPKPLDHFTSLQKVSVNSRLLRDSIALFVALHPINKDTGLPNVEKTVLVGNSYFFFSPLYEDVKIMQSLFTTRILHQFQQYLTHVYAYQNTLLSQNQSNLGLNNHTNFQPADHTIITVLCGDFNSSPSSAASRAIFGEILNSIDSIDCTHPDHDKLLDSLHQNFILSPEEQRAERQKHFLKVKQAKLIQQMNKSGEKGQKSDQDNKGGTTTDLQDADAHIVLDTTNSNEIDTNQPSVVTPIQQTQQNQQNQQTQQTQQVLILPSPSLQQQISTSLPEVAPMAQPKSSSELSNLKLELKLAMERIRIALKSQVSHDNFIRSLTQLHMKRTTTNENCKQGQDQNCDQIDAENSVAKPNNVKLDQKILNSQHNVILPLVWEYYLRYSKTSSTSNDDSIISSTPSQILPKTHCMHSKLPTTLCTLSCPYHTKLLPVHDDKNDYEADIPPTPISTKPLLVSPCALPTPPIILVGDMIAFSRTLRGLGVDTVQILIQPHTGFFPCVHSSLTPYITRASTLLQNETEQTEAPIGQSIEKKLPFVGNIHFKMAENDKAQSSGVYQQIIDFALLTHRIIITAIPTLLTYYQSLLIGTKDQPRFLNKNNLFTAPAEHRHRYTPDQLPLIVYLPPVQSSFLGTTYQTVKSSNMNRIINAFSKAPVISTSLPAENNESTFTSTIGNDSDKFSLTNIINSNLSSFSSKGGCLLGDGGGIEEDYYTYQFTALHDYFELHGLMKAAHKNQQNDISNISNNNTNTVQNPEQKLLIEVEEHEEHDQMVKIPDIPAFYPISDVIAQKKRADEDESCPDLTIQTSLSPNPSTTSTNNNTTFSKSHEQSSTPMKYVFTTTNIANRKINKYQTSSLVSLFINQTNPHPIQSLYSRLLCLHTATALVLAPIEDQTTGSNQHSFNRLHRKDVVSKSTQRVQQYVDIPRPNRNNIRLCALFGILQSGISTPDILTRCTHCNHPIPEQKRGCAKDSHCTNPTMTPNPANSTQRCEEMRCLYCVEYFVGHYSTLFPSYIQTSYFINLAQLSSSLNSQFIQNSVGQALSHALTLPPSITAPQKQQQQQQLHVSTTPSTITSPQSHLAQMTAFKRYIFHQFPIELTMQQIEFFFFGKYRQQSYKLAEYNNDINLTLHNIDTSLFCPQMIDSNAISNDLNINSEATKEVTFSIEPQLVFYDYDVSSCSSDISDNSNSNASNTTVNPTSSTNTNTNTLEVSKGLQVPKLFYNSNQLALFIEALDLSHLDPNNSHRSHVHSIDQNGKPTPTTPIADNIVITSIQTRTVLLHWLIGTLGPTSLFISHLDFLSRYLASNEDANNPNYSLTSSKRVKDFSNSFPPMNSSHPEYSFQKKGTKNSTQSELDEIDTDLDSSSEIHPTLNGNTKTPFSGKKSYKSMKSNVNHGNGRNDRNHDGDDDDDDDDDDDGDDYNDGAFLGDYFTESSSRMIFDESGNYVPIPIKSLYDQPGVVSESEHAEQGVVRLLRLEKRKAWRRERKLALAVVAANEQAQKDSSTLHQLDEANQHETTKVTEQSIGIESDGSKIMLQETTIKKHSSGLQLLGDYFNTDITQDSTVDSSKNTCKTLKKSYHINSRSMLSTSFAFDDELGDDEGNGTINGDDLGDDLEDDFDIYTPAPPLPPPPTTVKLYVTDGLSKLAKTLRTIGVDTEYGFPSAPDLGLDAKGKPIQQSLQDKIAAMLETCRNEERILVTNWKQVTQRRNCPPYILLPSTLPDNLQISSFVEPFQLPRLESSTDTTNVNYPPSKKNQQHVEQSSNTSTDGEPHPHQCHNTPIWSYKFGNQGFVKYDPDTNTQVETAYQEWVKNDKITSHSTVWITPLPKRVYIVDFLKMNQRSNQTDFLRQIARVEGPPGNGYGCYGVTECPYHKADSGQGSSIQDNRTNPSLENQFGLPLGPKINISDYHLYLIKTHLNFSFESSRMYIRCTLCNGSFKSLSIHEIRQMTFLPSSIKTGRNKFDKKKLDFYMCIKCHQIFWWGSKSESSRDRLSSFLGDNGALVITPENGKALPALPKAPLPISTHINADFSSSVAQLIPLENATQAKTDNNQTVPKYYHWESIFGSTNCSSIALVERPLAQNNNSNIHNAVIQNTDVNTPPPLTPLTESTTQKPVQDSSTIAFDSNSQQSRSYRPHQKRSKELKQSDSPTIYQVDVSYTSSTILASIKHPLLFGLFINPLCVIQQQPGQSSYNSGQAMLTSGIDASSELHNNPENETLIQHGLLLSPLPSDISSLVSVFSSTSHMNDITNTTSTSSQVLIPHLLQTNSSNPYEKQQSAQENVFLGASIPESTKTPKNDTQTLNTTYTSTRPQYVPSASNNVQNKNNSNNPLLTNLASNTGPIGTSAWPQSSSSSTYHDMISARIYVKSELILQSVFSINRSDVNHLIYLKSTDDVDPQTEKEKTTLIPFVFRHNIYNPLFTNAVADFQGCLDYICIGVNVLKYKSQLHQAGLLPKPSLGKKSFLNANLLNPPPLTNQSSSILTPYTLRWAMTLTTCGKDSQTCPCRLNIEHSVNHVLRQQQLYTEFQASSDDTTSPIPALARIHETINDDSSTRTTELSLQVSSPSTAPPSLPFSPISHNLPTPTTPSQDELAPALLIDPNQVVICPRALALFFKNGFGAQTTPPLSFNDLIQDKSFTSPPYPNKANPSDHCPIVASFDIGF